MPEMRHDSKTEMLARVSCSNERNDWVRGTVLREVSEMRTDGVLGAMTPEQQLQAHLDELDLWVHRIEAQVCKLAEDNVLLVEMVERLKSCREENKQGPTEIEP